MWYCTHCDSDYCGQCGKEHRYGGRWLQRYQPTQWDLVESYGEYSKVPKNLQKPNEFAGTKMGAMSLPPLTIN
jgi:hypothetical protein